MFQKQHAFKIGEAIADVMIQHLTWKRLGKLMQIDYDRNWTCIDFILDTAVSITDKYGYWIVMLSSISSLLLEGENYVRYPLGVHFLTSCIDRPQAQVITTTLINFKQLDGIKAVTQILETFWHEVESLPASIEDEGALSKEDHQKMVHAYGGIKVVLSLIANITSFKSVMEAPQTAYLQSRERDKDRPDYFNPSQLLVELRFGVMPTVRAMWEASFVDKASCSIVKSIIDILGIILKADGETSAFSRKDTDRKPSFLSWRSMEPNEEKLQQIMDMGFPRQEAQSALLRCNGVVDDAANWLLSQRRSPRQGESQASATSSRPQTADSSAESEDGTDVDVTREEPTLTPLAPTNESPLPAVEPAPPATTAPEDAPEPGLVSAPQIDPTPMNIDETPTTPTTTSTATAAVVPEATKEIAKDKGKNKEDSKSNLVLITVEDLNDIRKLIRDNLINRSLDVLQVHPDVTFELSGLINNAFGKGQDNMEAKKEVASTIVQSLMSLQNDDDFRPQSRTISATAHLLGLILQNQEFYEACLEDLKEQISVLVGFMKIYPNEPAPWVANILLVIEKILAEASQPRQVKFNNANDQLVNTPVVELIDFTISTEDNELLFTAIMDIVPLIIRDEVLALAVTRVLAIITRHRHLAIRMAETDYLQRLFHMFKRHAGLSTTRIQNCMLYVLRHIIEDEDTIKTVMKTDILNWFQQRGSRQIDLNAYIRHTSHLVLRAPEAFVEVTNEICKLTRYDPNLGSLRPPWEPAAGTGSPNDTQPAPPWPRSIPKAVRGFRAPAAEPGPARGRNRADSSVPSRQKYRDRTSLRRPFDLACGPHGQNPRIPPNRGAYRPANPANAATRARIREAAYSAWRPPVEETRGAHCAPA